MAGFKKRVRESEELEPLRIGNLCPKEGPRELQVVMPTERFQPENDNRFGRKNIADVCVVWNGDTSASCGMATRSVYKVAPLNIRVAAAPRSRRLRHTC